VARLGHLIINLQREKLFTAQDSTNLLLRYIVVEVSVITGISVVQIAAT